MSGGYRNDIRNYLVGVCVNLLGRLLKTVLMVSESFTCHRNYWSFFFDRYSSTERVEEERQKCSIIDEDGKISSIKMSDRNLSELTSVADGSFAIITFEDCLFGRQGFVMSGKKLRTSTPQQIRDAVAEIHDTLMGYRSAILAMSDTFEDLSYLRAFLFSEDDPKHRLYKSIDKDALDITFVAILKVEAQRSGRDESCLTSKPTIKLFLPPAYHESHIKLGDSLRVISNRENCGRDSHD